jgi:hypothetical protein
MAKSIELNYIKGLIPASELDSIRSKLQDQNIKLECHDLLGQPQAAVEDLLAHVVLFLSSDFMQAYILGLASNATYDCIKNCIANIWQFLSEKKIYRYSGKGVEHVAANFDLDIETKQGTKVKFKLKDDIPDNLIEKCIDSAFQLLESKTFTTNSTGYVCLYSVDQNDWEIYEYLDFLKKFAKPRELDRFSVRD